MPQNKNINFQFKTAIYPLEAVINASYAFLDKAYIYLDQPKSGSVKVTLKAKKGSAAKIKDDFLNELLFAVERLNAAKRNKRVREFIIGKALFGAIDNDNLPPAAPEIDGEDSDDYLDDPLGIKVPWNEKE